MSAPGTWSAFKLKLMMLSLYGSIYVLTVEVLTEPSLPLTSIVSFSTVSAPSLDNHILVVPELPINAATGDMSDILTA